MKQWMLSLALAMLVADPAAMAQDDARTKKAEWLKAQAAETLNVMIGQHKGKAQARQEAMQAYLDANKLDDDYESSSFSKKPNPNNYTFDQLYRGALKHTVSQGLPPVPEGKTAGQLQSLANATVQLAKESYEQLMPLAQSNFDMQAYLQANNHWDSYQKWAGDRVKQQKAAYEQWLQQAKAQKAKDDVVQDAARRKALLAISDQERAQRAEDYQRQLQLIQTQETANEQRYAIKHYHPAYGWGDSYGDAAWRYRDRGFRRHVTAGGVVFPGGGGGGDGGDNTISQVGAQALGEANKQLNEATEETRKANEARLAADKDYIDASTKTQANINEADMNMPQDGESLPSDVIRDSATQVTQEANDAAANLVPDVKPQDVNTPEQPEAPAVEPQAPAEEAQTPEAPAE